MAAGLHKLAKTSNETKKTKHVEQDRRACTQCCTRMMLNEEMRLQRETPQQIASATWLVQAVPSLAVAAETLSLAYALVVKSWPLTSSTPLLAFAKALLPSSLMSSFFWYAP